MKNIKMKKTATVLIIIDIIAVICFFLTYGPISYFRDFLITTAMTTMNHKYLARIFYTDKMIQDVMSKNYISGFSENTNPSEIEVGNISKEYANEYEKAILDRKASDVYKIIETKYNGYNVYITAIYDPTRVSVMQTSSLGYEGEYITTMARKNKALVAINGGGFEDPEGMGNGGNPMGVVLKDGKVAYQQNGTNWGDFVGITDDGVLVLLSGSIQEALKAGVRDAVQFGPFLIMNGNPANIVGNGGWGTNPRTAIAQRKDGIILFVVVDGNGTKFDWNGRGGVTLNGLVEILQRYGAYNAANMDGGASTAMVVNNKLYNNPVAYSDSGERGLPNGWMVR